MGVGGNGSLQLGNSAGLKPYCYDGTANFPCRTQPMEVLSLLETRVISGVTQPPNTYVRQIAAGGDFSLVLKAGTDQVWGWGNLYNHFGGDGYPPITETPIALPGLSGVRQIAAGNKFGLVVKWDGTVWGWGSNIFGEAGGADWDSCSQGWNGPYWACARSPIQVPGISGAFQIAAGAGTSLALVRDVVPPTTTAVVSPTPNAAMWNKIDTTVSLSAVDETGGSGVQRITYSAAGAQSIASTSVETAAGSVVISSEGNTTLTFQATDKDGNIEAPKTIVVSVDKTAPTGIAGVAARAPDQGPWYRSSVIFNFTGTDALSGMAPCTDPSYGGPDGADVSVTGLCADLAGNEGTAIKHLSFDGTPPFITSSRTPAANAFGWTNGDVTVSFACSDITSGIESCAPGSQVVSTEGAGQAVTGTAVDKAGNQASATERVSIDRTAPTITASRLPLANAFGWSNADVTVSFGCTDALSGIDGCEPNHVLGEGDNQSVTGAAADKAGNQASASLASIRIDKTPPAVNCAGPDGVWHKEDVSVGCTAGDALSGLRVAADAAFTLVTSVPPGTETANAATGSHAVPDLAGNVATGGSMSGNKVDRKAPAILIAAPLAMTYTINQVLPAGYTCSDGGSGVATCTGTVASGNAFGTSVAGTHSFSVTAQDQVGNAAGQTVSYVVAYGVCLLYDPARAKNSGSVFPVKVSVCDAGGQNLSNAALGVTGVGIVKVSDATPAILDSPGNANPDGNFRFDPTLGAGGGYVFNLSTAGLTSGTYAVSFVIRGDPTVHNVQIGLK